MKVVYSFIAFIIALITLVFVLQPQAGAISPEDMGTVTEYCPPARAFKPAVSDPESDPEPEPEPAESAPENQDHITYHLTKSTVFEIADQLEFVLDSMYITDDDIVEVYDDGLTAGILESRAGKWIIEIVYGSVVSEWGDGETDDGYYITYAGVSGVELGKRYRTFEVYNPLTGYIDDILERFDFEL